MSKRTISSPFCCEISSQVIHWLYKVRSFFNEEFLTKRVITSIVHFAVRERHSHEHRSIVRSDERKATGKEMRDLPALDHHLHHPCLFIDVIIFVILTLFFWSLSRSRVLCFLVVSLNLWRLRRATFILLFFLLIPLSFSSPLTSRLLRRNHKKLLFHHNFYGSLFSFLADSFSSLAFPSLLYRLFLPFASLFFI